jgi:photosystem II stability/assembly factor-like uncharacterized protein
MEVEMKKIIMIVICVMCGVVTAQTWEEIGFNLPPGDSTSYSTNITFTSKNNGWLYIQHYRKAGNTIYKKLYKTTDGGQSWKAMRTEINNNYYYTVVYAIEPDFFYMVNKKNNPGYSSKAIYTTNGGTTWDSTTIANGATFYGFSVLHFFDKEKGLAVDENSWLTTDGGKTWKKKGELSYPYDIYFPNEKLGWAVGEGPNSTESGYVAKTTDGGNTWEYSDYIYFPPLNGITFIDPLKGFAVGASQGGGYFKTTDSGENWHLSPEPGYGFDIEFLDDKNGWISSWGQIFRTSDEGETWEGQFDNYINYRLEKLIMLKKDKIAYVLGVNPDSNTATLLKADLSAITGIEKKEKTLPAKFNLYQNYPNPFNPTTVISYTIGTSQLSVSSHVTLKIYDLLGKEVATLVDGYKQAGTYNVTFNVETLHATSLPSGVYYYRLTAGSFSETKKMAVLK